MDYILKGNPQDVEKVIRENRIRVQRGVISFTPLDCDVHTDNSDVIANLQERCEDLQLSLDKECEEHSAACKRANDLESTITRLKEAGVDIDLILDEQPEATDSKEDVAEVTDTKEEPQADSKEEPAPDTKEPEATPEVTDTKAPKKRTKKTE